MVSHIIANCCSQSYGRPVLPHPVSGREVKTLDQTVAWSLTCLSLTYMDNGTTKWDGEFRNRVDMIGKRLPRVLSVSRSREITRWRFLCIVGYMGLKLKGDVMAGDRFGNHDMGSNSVEAMQMGTMTQEEDTN